MRRSPTRRSAVRVGGREACDTARFPRGGRVAHRCPGTAIAREADGRQDAGGGRGGGLDERGGGPQVAEWIVGHDCLLPAGAPVRHHLQHERTEELDQAVPGGSSPVDCTPVLPTEQGGGVATRFTSAQQPMGASAARCQATVKTDPYVQLVIRVSFECRLTQGATRLLDQACQRVPERGPSLTAQGACHRLRRPPHHGHAPAPSRRRCRDRRAVVRPRAPRDHSSIRRGRPTTQGARLAETRATGSTDDAVQGTDFPC